MFKNLAIWSHCQLVQVERTHTRILFERFTGWKNHHHHHQQKQQRQWQWAGIGDGGGIKVIRTTTKYLPYVGR